jgi:hypothetical protein
VPAMRVREPFGHFPVSIDNVCIRTRVVPGRR